MVIEYPSITSVWLGFIIIKAVTFTIIAMNSYNLHCWQAFH